MENQGNARRELFRGPLRSILGLIGCAIVAGCDQQMPVDGLTSNARGITTRTGVDYSWARPAPADLVGGGYAFVMRYVSGDFSSGKDLTASEVQSLQAAGIDIGVVWENGATDSLGGYDQGVSDAQNAESEARAIGMPSGRPIYFAVDWDVSASEEAAIASYFDGVASVLGRSRTGAYGGYDPINYLFDNGKIAYGWQTYAWSGDQWDSRAQLRQTLNGGACSGGCDIDQAVADDFGQWGYRAPPPATQGESSRAFGLERRHSQPSVNVFYPADDGHGTLQMAYVDGSGWTSTTICGGRWTSGPLSAIEDNEGAVRVYYHDPGDDEVHECWLNPSTGEWSDWTFGIGVADGTTAFYDRASGVSHVFYHVPGAAPEIWESYLDDSGWHHHSLGRWSQGTPWAIKTTYDGNSNVFYHDPGDHKLHQLWSSAGGSWQDYNSGMGISNSPVAVEAILPTPTNPRGTMRVYYAGIDANHTMHEYYSDPSTNTWSDRSTGDWMTPGSSAAVTQDESGVVRVYYSDGFTNPGNLFELYLDGSGWHRGDQGQCALTCGNREASGSAFAMTLTGGNVSVVYRDSGSGKLNDLYLDGAGWHLNEWEWRMAP